MLEGYKPIDFGNLFSKQPELGQVRNRVGLTQAALDILSNSSFSTTPVSSFLSQGYSATGEAPKRKQTGLGRVMDFLSAPVYAVANATDDAIAGHQMDDRDSVLHDAMEIIGGIGSGLGRGFATGMRGAFAPSETAADPQDKIYLGDALIRLDTHMSAEDAMKPENTEKVRKRLEQKHVNMLSDDEKDKYFYDFKKGRVDVSDQDIKDYFKDMQLYGLGASAIADPLNFVNAGSKVANLTKGAKGASEVPNAVTDFSAAINKNTTPSINVKNFVSKRTPGSYKVELNPGSVQNRVANPATGELITPPAWFDFPRNADELTATRTTRTTPVANEVDPLLDPIINAPAPGADIQAIRQIKNPSVAQVPKDQLRLATRLSSPKQQTRLITDLLRRMSTGDFDNAISRLDTGYSGIDFARTKQLIRHASTIPDFVKRLNIPVEHGKIVNAFRNVISSEVAAAKVAPRLDDAAYLINRASEIGPVAMNRIVAGAKPQTIAGSKNPTRDFKIVQEVVDHFKPQLDLTQVPAGIKNPTKYRSAMQKHGALTGPKQVNAWNMLTSKYLVNAKTPKRFEKALDLLRYVEDQFITMGHVPMSSTPKLKNSVPLRLSQVIDAIGPAAAAMNRTLLTKILRGDADALAKLSSEAVDKINAMKAGEAIVDGTKLAQGVEAASKSIEDLIKGPISAARTEDIVTIGSRVADDIAQAAGGSPVAGNKAAQIIKEEFVPKSPGDNFPVTNTTALISHADVSSNLLKKYSSADTVTKDIHRILGGPTPKELGRQIGPRSMALEWLGARFNAAYKNADMRPIYLRNAATAKSTVAKRAEYLNNLAKKFNVNDENLWNEGLKGAQGKLDPLPGSPEAQLSQEILQVMENLFGSSGLKSSVALENSVTGRSQLFMGELNRNLRRFGLGSYQFTKKGDYAEGTKWLNSWESWDIKEPLGFLFKIQNVVEHTVREKIMFDEIIARFGTRQRGGIFTHSVKTHPRLGGVYFGKEAASQVEQFVKNLRDISKPSSKALQHFDKVLSKWKAGVTIYIPSHHIRNLIGDVYMNWLAGVNSTRSYGTALKVMQSQKNRYEGLEELSTLTSPDALQKALTGTLKSTPEGKRIALTMRNGKQITNDQVYVSAFQQGILPTTRVIEDIPDDAISGLDRFRPLGGKGQKAAHTISEGRDHYVRLAHYVDALRKSSKSFEEAVNDAAATIRKWHPDGMDLTKFERNTVRRLFPFYSWTRKATPLIIESLVATPGKFMAYPKAQYLLQNMLGDPNNIGPMSDPFPYDQLFPDWIREKGIGPIMGESGDYTVMNPSNPSLDILSQLNHPGRMAMGMLNPAARIPIELATGTDTQTGAPIGGITDTDYLAKQLPGVSHLGRATGEFGVSDTTKERSGGVNWQNIANMLTALGIQNTGPYVKSAEFDLRDYIKSQRKQ